MIQKDWVNSLAFQSCELTGSLAKRTPHIHLHVTIVLAKVAQDLNLYCFQGITWIWTKPFASLIFNFWGWAATLLLLPTRGQCAPEFASESPVCLLCLQPAWLLGTVQVFIFIWITVIFWVFHLKTFRTTPGVQDSILQLAVWCCRQKAESWSGPALAIHWPLEIPQRTESDSFIWWDDEVGWVLRITTMLTFYNVSRRKPHES